MRWAGAAAWMLRAVPYLTAAGAAASPAVTLLAARCTRIGVETGNGDDARW